MFSTITLCLLLLPAAVPWAIPKTRRAGGDFVIVWKCVALAAAIANRGRRVVAMPGSGEVVFKFFCGQGGQVLSLFDQRRRRRGFRVLQD